MKEKTKKVLKWTSLTLAVSIITMVASMKIAALPQLVEIYSGLGLQSYMKILGLTEILFGLLFLWPRSMKIGFLLLTAYYGGAMAVEFSHGHIFILPALILSIIWTAAYLREPGLFLYQQNKNSNLAPQ